MQICKLLPILIGLAPTAASAGEELFAPRGEPSTACVVLAAQQLTRSGVVPQASAWRPLTQLEQAQLPSNVQAIIVVLGAQSAGLQIKYRFVCVSLRGQVQVSYLGATQ